MPQVIRSKFETLSYFLKETKRGRNTVITLLSANMFVTPIVVIAVCKALFPSGF
jgi:hypothetical protein